MRSRNRTIDTAYLRESRLHAGPGRGRGEGDLHPHVNTISRSACKSVWPKMEHTHSSRAYLGKIVSRLSEAKPYNFLETSLNRPCNSATYQSGKTVKASFPRLKSYSDMATTSPSRRQKELVAFKVEDRPGTAASK